MVAGIAALAAELGAGVMAHRSAEKALGELAGRKQERDELARRVPAPDETVAQALARDLAQARAVLGRYEVLVRGTEPERWAAPLPVKSIDAHFELAAFVDRARTAAAQAHVALPPGEHFGFASYASEGPEP